VGTFARILSLTALVFFFLLFLDKNRAEFGAKRRNNPFGTPPNTPKTPNSRANRIEQDLIFGENPRV